MSTLELNAGARVAMPAPRGRNVFFYVVRGALKFGGRDVSEWRLVEFQDDGDVIAIEAAADSFVLFGHAPPIGEPVFAHGPFVMNTREEIVQAISDYQAGKFGPPPAV
jgi:redox-sensitive bicupin YhaK (pirin superfamily)